MQILHNLAISFLGIYIGEMKTDIHIKLYTQMFIVTLFIIVKIWKQLNCVSVGECLNKVVHPYHGLLLSNKKDELLIHITAWMKFQKSMLSEKSQCQKIIYWKIPLWDIPEMTGLGQERSKCDYKGNMVDPHVM